MVTLCELTRLEEWVISYYSQIECGRSANKPWTCYLFKPNKEESEVSAFSCVGNVDRLLMVFLGWYLGGKPCVKNANVNCEITSIIYIECTISFHLVAIEFFGDDWPWPWELLGKDLDWTVKIVRPGKIPHI